MHRSKYALMGSVAVCATVMALSSTAFAQQSAAGGDSPQVSEVTVTGSRIISDGTDAPTPVEVVGAETIENQAGGDVASVLSTIPVFSGNITPGTQNIQPSAGTTGLNLVNLRGLGPNRTLVLVDGERFVPTLTYGSSSVEAVDLGGIPQQLIQRVETVTGGASAVYGSDAIGGVVNFILDRKFTGLKMDASGGETTYGDGANEKLDLTYGTRFANDRGHFILSGEMFTQNAINNTSNRAWNYKNNYCVMANPNYAVGNGQPFRLLENNCGEDAPPGGVINTSTSSTAGVQSFGASPIGGITFGVGGVPLPFHYGSLVSTPFMSGGDYLLTTNERLVRGGSLEPEERRANIFALLSYDLTDRIKATYNFAWTRTGSRTNNFDDFFDSPTGVSIKSDNAFIPASLRPTIAANNITSFIVGTINGDLPTIKTYNTRYTQRHLAALDGDFDLFKTDWTWNAYYQYGISRNNLNADAVNRSRYALATDAVVGANGSIQCRVNTDASTANDVPACVPYDIFGLGVNSPQAIAYVQGTGTVNQDNTQQVYSATLTGKPFSLWAGPIGIALNFEHRIETASGTASADALASTQFSGNYKPINGGFNVTEGAVEVNIPLAKDFVLAKAANLDLAVRETGYSTSGNVTTWKVGATYTPIDDISFRGNYSHDIRAANLGELFAFAGAPTVSSNTFDPFTGQNVTTRVSARGNPTLNPEEADSYGVGAVFKPRFLPGFSASIDYFHIDQKGQISTLSGAQALQLCFNGNQQACSFITRVGAATVPGIGPYAGQLFAPLDINGQIQTAYVNIASNLSSGIDTFAAYRFPVKSIPFLPFNGDVSLRYDGTYFARSYQNPGLPGSLPTQTLPFWRGLVSGQYDVANWSIGLTGRFASKDAVGQYSAQTIYCTTNCPTLASIPANFTTQNAALRSSQAFMDLNLSYKLMIKGADAELYFNVRNVFNVAPPLQAPSVELFGFNQSEVGDDTIGRIFRVGLRMKM